MSGKAFIAVDLALLKRMFCLPGNYEVAGVYPSDLPDTVYFVVQSEELPDVPGKDGMTIPQIELHSTVMTHPTEPAFKMVETRLTMDGKDIANCKA